MSAPDDSYAATSENHETNLLCALMWSDSKHPTTKTTIEYLDPSDFYSPLHGQLFQIIKEKYQSAEPFSAQLINESLQDEEQRYGNAAALQPLLVEAMTASVVIPEQAEGFADQILSASYRRHFTAMTTTLATAAEHASEDKLFTIMVEHGKRQREAHNRRAGFKPAVAHAKQQAEKLNQRAELFRQRQQSQTNASAPARAPATNLTDMLSVSTNAVSIHSQPSPEIHDDSQQQVPENQHVQESIR